MILTEWKPSPWLVSIAASMVAFKIWMKVTTGRYRGQEKLTGKTVIVTGANSGIGYEAAKDFAHRGAKLVMVCRDMKKAENAKKQIIDETKNINIVLKHVDFESLSNVRECAYEILSEEKEIHILLNNAGVVSGSFTKTSDGLDKLMQTNHFGPFLFTNILLERIKTSTPSRIVNVSSETHRMTKFNVDNELNVYHLADVTSHTTAYGNSKLCNILMANELARKLKGKGVTVNSLTPGVVLTEILRDATPWFAIPWNLITKIFLKNVKEGAQTSIYACVCSDISDVSGKYFMDCKPTNAAAICKDENVARRLWELSEKAVDLKETEKHY